MKKNRNKGFTLGELLIVVAIIGVLVAISIPIFTSQLEKAREATDAANIRSQYAEVMVEAITDGGDVDGKDMFGAVEIKQKKDEWQSTGLKENLEGVYGQVVGEYPKAGGTAWVEYKDDQAILHYEGGSGSSGGGSTGGGNTGGSTAGSTGGGSTAGNTGGGNTGEGNTGDGSGANSDLQGSGPSGVLNIITSKATEIQEKPQETDNKTYNIKISKGNIYTYKGETYIATTDTVLLNKYNWPAPDTSWATSYYVKVGNNKVLTSADSSDGYNLPDTKYGDIYQTDDGELYLFVAQDNYIIPSDGDDKWVKINLNS